MSKRVILEHIKHIEFDKDKFHILFVDPNQLRVEDLIASDFMNTPGPECIVIPVRGDPRKAAELLAFESIDALEGFVRDLKAGHV